MKFSLCLTWFNKEEEVIKWSHTAKVEMQAKNAAFMHFGLQNTQRCDHKTLLLRLFNHLFS